MFISDVISNKHEIHHAIIQSLRNLGIKHRITKNKHSQNIKIIAAETRLFKVPLGQLSCEVVVLNDGIGVEVPCFIAAACKHIKEHVETEGIFRKAGSTARQKELRAYLDSSSGKKFGPEHHVIDVANILKLFLRELPEPLLPRAYHDTLLRCLLLKDRIVEGLLLTCLLIPSAHINTLTYLMQFFQQVASHSIANKMDITNLAIIVTPSVMPIEEKIVVHGTSQLAHHVQVVELLIKNADKIGSLPQSMCGNNFVSNDEESRHSKKKKKRRSGSLTRMLNGLKKMVGKGTPEVEESHLITSTPDFSTPYVKAGKKRKAPEVTSGFSSKKKRDVLQMLPQSVALANIPYTPTRSLAHGLYVSSPVCAHPNPNKKSKSPQLLKTRHRRFFTPKSHSESVTNKIINKDCCKKSRLSIGTGKKQKPEELALRCNRFGSDISCHLESWSRSSWSREKHLNLSAFSPSIGTSDGENAYIQESFLINSSDNDHALKSADSESIEMEFVRIPKSEYEAIKIRVSAIENRISQEFGNVIGSESESNNESNNNTELVQSAYERTLEESEKLGDTSTDQLAKRLSRELRIHQSKVIRSPSARKIGTIRRRSKENTKPFCRKSPVRNEVARNMSWHLALKPSFSQISQVYPCSNLKRGRPNTILTGLPQPSPRNTTNVEESTRIILKFQHDNAQVTSNKRAFCNDYFCLVNDNSKDHEKNVKSEYYRESDGPVTRSKTRRSSSFHGSEWTVRNKGFDMNSLSNLKKFCSYDNIAQIKGLSVEENNKIDEWHTADAFFRNSRDIEDNTPITGRASIAKLRSQNAGMVLQRMKLFDTKVNCSLEQGDREKCIPDNKEKRLVHIPSVFVRNREVTQSLRVQQSGHTSKPDVSKSIKKKKSPLNIKSEVEKKEENYFKISPKKMGTPRRKQVRKSPNDSQVIHKLKVTKSPARDEMSRSVPHRKHNSMKLNRDKICTNNKANLTVPVNWLGTEKENVLSPDNAYLKSSERSHSKKDLQFMSQAPVPNMKESSTVMKLCKASPLKDCNRIEVSCQVLNPSNKDTPTMNSLAHKTSRMTPYIKQPLLVKSPGDFSKTPIARNQNEHRHRTPVKALASIAFQRTPIGPSRRQSPRLLVLKS